MAMMNPRSRSTSAGRARQHGYVLLLTLITLLVLLFGVLFTLRGGLLQTTITGNVMQRQKDVQASDLALRQVQQLIIQTAQGAGNVPLELAASGSSWFYMPPTSSTPWTPPGTGSAATYWQTCKGAGTCAQLSSITSGISGFDALVTVVPSNLANSDSACATTGYTARYYDIFMHTTESSGSTGASTETLFKLCVPGSS